MTKDWLEELRARCEAGDGPESQLYDYLERALAVIEAADRLKRAALAYMTHASTDGGAKLATELAQALAAYGKARHGK